VLLEQDHSPREVVEPQQEKAVEGRYLVEDQLEEEPLLLAASASEMKAAVARNWRRKFAENTAIRTEMASKLIRNSFL